MVNLSWLNLENQKIEVGTLKKESSFIIYSSTVQTEKEDVTIQVKLFSNWHVHSFEINQGNDNLFKGSYTDQWLVNGELLKCEEEISFIDISLTPFTNTLVINNMKENNLHKKKVPMLFIDCENNEIKICHQLYKINGNEVHYENIETNYINTLQINANGFIVNYPESFRLLE